MSELGRFAVSRRGLLQAAAAGSAILFGSLISTSGAAAATGSSTAVKTFKADESTGFTNIEGVWAEYLEAIAAFPLTLPDGWTFPPQSKQRDPEPGVLWERGNGEAEAYFFWQRAMATAANEAHLRGDKVEASRLLDLLEAGYDTSTRRAVLEDLQSTFVTDAIEPARTGSSAARGVAGGGNFGPLMHVVTS